VKNGLAVHQNLNIKLSYDPAIALLHIYPKELKTSFQTKTFVQTQWYIPVILTTQEAETRE
jgi:hypothetical protein